MTLHDDKSNLRQNIQQHKDCREHGFAPVCEPKPSRGRQVFCLKHHGNCGNSNVAQNQRQRCLQLRNHLELQATSTVSEKKKNRKRGQFPSGYRIVTLLFLELIMNPGVLMFLQTWHTPVRSLPTTLMTALHDLNTARCKRAVFPWDPNLRALSQPHARRVRPHSLHQRQSGNHRRAQPPDRKPILQTKAQKHGSVAKFSI